jgi:pyruvate,orthophosphate dikinase
MVNFYSILPGAALAKGGAVEVGNKAWNMMRMVQAGLPVPHAFVLPTRWCQPIQTVDETALRRTLCEGMRALEGATGQTLGAKRNPLLISVRSGAALSMPGMMETS